MGCGPAQLSKMSELRWGTPARAGSNRIRPSVPLASHSGQRSLYPIHGRRSSSPCSAHSMGKASSLFGGRILKCLPHPSHARRHPQWRAQLSKMNELRWGDSCTGWLEENSALCSPGFALRASLVVSDTRSTQLLPLLCSLHGKGIIFFIRGPNFEMRPPSHRTLGSTHRGGGPRLQLGAPGR